MAKIALLIGVSDYEPGLNQLPGAKKDIEAMQQVLQHPEMGDFDSVQLLPNPERQSMEEAIFELFANRDKNDLVLLYFSGHGIKDENNKLYLATRITRKNNQGQLITPTAVAASAVHSAMNISNRKSRRQVVILDCCFSGAFPEGLSAKNDGAVDIKNQLGGEGRAILTSSTATQYSFEQQGSELSVYTRYIVEGIKTGAADLDNNGAISVDELHNYAKGKVQEAAPAMNPEIYAIKEGYNIRIAKAPIGDPKLKYRKDVEEFVMEDGGEISFLSRHVLDDLRASLALLPEDADVIENEVLQPYRERKAKLQRYEQVLAEATKNQFPLQESTRKRLKRLQEILRLRDEDIASIEAGLISQAKKDPPKTAPTFEFDVVTVNSQGKEINRQRSTAQFRIEDLGNGVILEMVYIPGGTFMMGSPDNEGDADEKPQHRVNIAPFYMGKYQITQSQWKVVAALPKINIDLNPDSSNFKGANRPVEQVNWHEAQEFCQRLSKKTGKIYRLPSEAEWEYACRAGTTTPFHFGDTITVDLANYDGNSTYASAPKGIYRKQTTDVGSFLPNAFGLYDMHGQVWEWCADPWHENYNDAPSDGTVWESGGDNQYRMLRGGSWLNLPRYCRSAYRYRNGPDGRWWNYGFRVVSVSSAWTH